MTVAKKPAAKTTQPRAPAKPAAKPAVKAAAKPAAKAAEPKASASVNSPATKAAKVEKVEKIKKPKLVRDSFTIPKPEYTVLEDLKQRAAKLGRPVKKSELLRAGIKALAAMADVGFLGAVQAVPAIKTGRPTGAKAAA
jgi:hypothetical protein